MFGAVRCLWHTFSALVLSLLALSPAAAFAQDTETFAQDTETIEVHNNALRIAKDLCISVGRIDQLEVVAEVTGGFALRKIGAQGDAEVLHRSTTMEGIANGIDEAIVDEQLANTQAARECNERNYYRVLESLKGSNDQSRNSSPDGALAIWTASLAFSDGWKPTHHLATVAGAEDEYFVLARYSDDSDAWYTVFRIYLTSDPEQYIRYERYYDSHEPVYDIAWDARVGLILTKAARDDPERKMDVLAKKDDTLRRLWRSNYTSKTYAAKIAPAGGRYLAAEISSSKFNVRNRAFQRVFSGYLDLDRLGDIAAFADGKAIIVGADYYALGRPNGEAPTAIIVDAQAERGSIFRRHEGRERSFYTPGSYGTFAHIAMSPSRRHALALGRTTDLEPSEDSGRLIIAIFDSSGQVVFERTVSKWMSKLGWQSQTSSALWIDDTTAYVHFIDAEGSKRMTVDLNGGRSRIDVGVYGEDRAAAPSRGCAPLHGAQHSANRALILEACGGEERVLQARLMKPVEPS